MTESTEPQAPKVGKHAPARADGLKPWAVDVWSWGTTRRYIAWADSAAEARYAAVGRQQHTSAKARRATPADMIERTVLS